MITFDDLTVSYDGAQPVLRRVSFEVPEGDLCVVVGRTGTGKSTLLGAINGLVPHFSGGQVSGEVRVAGRSTRSHRPRDLADVVGFVGQDPLAGFVTDTVEDELAYGMEQLGVPPLGMRKRVEETLDVMGIADLRRRPLLSLSGGQQQRVAIGAVLAAQPRVLVLDEPTSALDPTAAQDVLSAITTLVHEVGLTVVMAEHRLERVMHAADSVLWLPGDGRAVLGPPGQVLAVADVVPPLAELAATLGWDEVPLSVRQARRRVAREELVLRPLPPRTPANGSATTAEALVRAESLSVRYGKTQAVRGVDLTIKAGERVALMGRNGAGKSSLLWALQGTQPSTGRLVVAGQDPRRAEVDHIRASVALVPQTPADLLYLPTVAQECAQADRESQRPPGSTAQLLALIGAQLDDHSNPRDLSEGQRLALVLAIQLVAAPPLVLLDEPTRGLDYGMKRELARFLVDLAEAGTAVVVSTHDVEFAASCSERTIVMGEGEVVADGPSAEVCTSSPAFAPQVAKVFHPAPVLTTADVRAALVRDLHGAH